uniref:Uncharacterized protein n=1 Tax=Anopheles farauti TaxID=69004 RepID=A0A182QBM7_9DIPT
MFTFPGGRREYGCSSVFRYSLQQPVGAVSQQVQPARHVATLDPDVDVLDLAIVQLPVVLQHIELLEQRIIQLVDLTRYITPGARFVQQEGYVVPGGDDEREAPMSHLKSRFRKWTLLMCDCSLVREVKLFGHCSHWWGRSVWIAMCDLMLFTIAPHTEHTIFSLLSDFFDSSHTHAGYSTPTPKIRQYGSKFSCKPDRFVKKTAIADVVLNVTARKRSRGHQAIDCGLPPIGNPLAKSFVSSVVTKSRCFSSRDQANDCSEPLAVFQRTRETRSGGTVQR